MSEFKVITQDFVTVEISTSKDDFCYNEKRFPKSVRVNDLKCKLELLTGGSADTMKIELYDKDNKLICMLNDDSAMLGSFPVEDKMRLHVVDKFSLTTELEFANVPKYELPSDAYDKKTDTVRAFMKKNKLGNYNEQRKNEEELLLREQEEERQLAESMLVDQRCQVTLPKAPRRLGTIKYAGKVEGLKGYFIGVQYDEPLGKNDGSLNGKRYFECPPNYGGFVKPQFVQGGDFPEEEFDLDEEI